MDGWLLEWGRSRRRRRYEAAAEDGSARVARLWRTTAASMCTAPSFPPEDAGNGSELPSGRPDGDGPGYGSGRVASGRREAASPLTAAVRTSCTRRATT